jgi:hypothetical protein
MSKPKIDWHELKPEPRPMLHAAFYARYLREVEHLSLLETAERVMARYPHTRPWLARFTERKPVDALEPRG